MAAFGGKVESIEAGRGVAASLVVIYHAARSAVPTDSSLPYFLGIEHFGHAGVDFFFVLSGFIIFYVHRGDIARPPLLAHYVERRVTRIYPLYWAVLLATIVLASVNHALPDVASLAANAALVPSKSEAIVGVSWTLQHEMLFYTLFALLICSRATGAIAFGLWLVVLIAADLFGLFPQFAADWPRVVAAFNFEFFFGMAAAFIAVRCAPPAPRLVLGLGAAAFAGCGLLESAGALDGYGNLARFCYGGSAALLVVALVAAEQRRLIAVPGVMHTLGKASYSIYLTHFIAIGVARKAVAAAGITLPPWLFAAFLMCCGIGGGILVSRLVEYPLMGLARAPLIRTPRASPTPSPHD